MAPDPSGPPPTGPQRGLAKAVRQLRRETNLSQESLAERAGIPPIRLSLIESGRDDPPWGLIREIAQALGVSMEKLSELAEEQEGP